MVKCQSKLIGTGVVAYTIGSTEPSPYKTEVVFEKKKRKSKSLTRFVALYLAMSMYVCNKCVFFR